jgi:hypothetical protein
MKYSAILGVVLLADASIATFLPRHKLSRRILQQHGNPLILTESNASEDGVSDGPSNGNVIYSANWAGAALQGTDFMSVTADVIIGPASTPPGGKPRTEYATTSWVGIDGIGCTTQALLQTGVDSYVEGGVVQYSPWYEWYPLPSTPFSGFPVKLGDEIRMNVTAYSATSGIAILQNLSTGKSVNHTFTNMAKLCFQSAEWIVEDFGSQSGLVNFANFTTVTFTNASALKADGSRVDTTGAQVFAIKQGNHVYTDCAVASSSSVSCKYT